MASVCFIRAKVALLAVAAVAAALCAPALGRQGRRGQGMEVHRGSEIQVYRGSTIDLFTADTIEPDAAAEIDRYEARGIPVIRATTISEYQGRHVEAYLDHLCGVFEAGRAAPYVAPTITPTRARQVKLMTRRELDQLMRNTMGTYRHSGTAGSASGGLNAAQVQAYQVLNHNIGVWFSGNPFSY